jgi:hypothetical protein
VKKSIEIARIIREENERLAAERGESPTPEASDDPGESDQDETDTTAEGPTERPAN